MLTGKTELVVIWENGEKDIWLYEDAAEAYKAGKGMKTALGGQITWYCVRPQVIG